MASAVARSNAATRSAGMPNCAARSRNSSSHQRSRQRARSRRASGAWSDRVELPGDIRGYRLAEAPAGDAAFAAGIAEVPGAEVLNEVVINQVLFRFDSDDLTAAALKAVQEGGVAWMSGSTWQGRQAIRISVSNWQTTAEDIDRTVAEFARAAG